MLQRLLGETRRGQQLDRAEDRQHLVAERRVRATDLVELRLLRITYDVIQIPAQYVHALFYLQR